MTTKVVVPSRLVWVLAFWMAAPAAAQTVTNVRVKQLADKTVEVLYDLAGAPSPGATVTLAYQAEECPAPGLTLQAAVLSGNFGAGVVTGTNRRIVWNAAATLPAGTLGSNFFVTVTAVNAATPTPTSSPTPTRTPTPTPTMTPTLTPTPTPTVPPNSPPTVALNVELDPCPFGSPCPLAQGATVFVGSKLKISLIVSGSMPVTEWRFDYDFHTSESTGGYLTNPDLYQVSSPPATLSLVGPCDPSAAGANASNGSSCWISVTTNYATGGPDFSVSPAEGTVKSLSLAFQATNTFGSATTFFTLNWKVPTTRLKSTTILLGQAVQDGSEGKPLSSGFKWYFSSAPGLFGDVLLQDTMCTGPSCVHSFPSSGTYGYWITVPYATGYTSPDCQAPCTTSKGTINVLTSGKKGVSKRAR